MTCHKVRRMKKQARQSIRFIILLTAFVALGFLFIISCEGPVNPWYCPRPNPLIIDTHIIWSVDDHPILITRDIYVTREGKLEILAGTQIPFLPGSEIICDPSGNMRRNPRLIVEGSLVLRGTQDGVISFVPSDSSSTMFGPLQISCKGPGQDECIIEWSSFQWIEISGYSPQIRFCTVGELYLDNAKDIEIVGNIIESISALDCDGVIAENTVNGGIYLRDDSLVVLRNQIFSNGWRGWAGITSAGSSTAYIVENCVSDCNVGLKIFSGSPTINFNDFINCETNIEVIPFLTSPEADTINAQYNWWDSTEEPAILSKIVFMSNGDVESNKVILINPFEMHPFMVCQ